MAQDLGPDIEWLRKAVSMASLPVRVVKASAFSCELTLVGAELALTGSSTSSDELAN
jgi:hypothetical protein